MNIIDVEWKKKIERTKNGIEIKSQCETETLNG